MRKKRVNKKTNFFRPAAGAVLVIIVGAALLYLWPEIRGRGQALVSIPEQEPAEETGDPPKEEPGDEAAAEPEEVVDPFEEREEAEETKERPGEKGEEEVEEDPVSAPEGEEYGPDEDFKVIADGDYLLALVTKETTLKPGYQPADLKPVPSYMNPSYQMRLRAEALEHLEKLWTAAKEDGVTLSIRSAYRSYETQKQLFRDYASRHGEEEANRFSARPGQSEHQLGTAVDFGGTDADFTARFGQTEQGRWLAENAHKYGFVKSYPQGKEEVTGYIYEPWHFRYIGVEQARQWKQSGLTLKEYLKRQPQDFE